MPTPAAAWFEVTGIDGPALQRFYGSLFDWQVEGSGGDSGYGLVQGGEKGVGGGIGPAQDGGPGQVTSYVEVDDPARPPEEGGAARGHNGFSPDRGPDFLITPDLSADPEGQVVGLPKGAVR
jgi:predicted enzyme related to lactoylglutathione lyase